MTCTTTGVTLGGGKFKNGAITGAFSRLFNDLGAHREIKTSVSINPAVCEIPSDCTRDSFLRFENVDRFERAKLLDVFSVPMNGQVSRGNILFEVGVQAGLSTFRIHYIDTVRISHTEQLFDVTRTEYFADGTLIGQRTTQSFFPSGQGLTRKVINSTNQGFIETSKVPFELR